MNANAAMGQAAAGDHHGLAGLHRIQQAGEVGLGFVQNVIGDTKPVAVQGFAGKSGHKF
jgi:hypothetical protein